MWDMWEMLHFLRMERNTNLLDDSEFSTSRPSHSWAWRKLREKWRGLSVWDKSCGIVVYRFKLKCLLLKGNVLLFKGKGLILINLSLEVHNADVGSVNNIKLNCMICKNPVRVQQKMKSPPQYEDQSVNAVKRNIRCYLTRKKYINAVCGHNSKFEIRL
jgi:hypothetical protein